MIEKNSPRKFVADKDQRLLEPGDMIVAENVTITERGEGSGSIVKTFKGVDASDPATSADFFEGDCRVVGKVEDPQRDFVYFFVMNLETNKDFIARHDASTGTYKVIFRSSWLNFPGEGGFVKADVINKDFARNGGLQTIIYFTDNINPPRKINVERAIAGDYDGMNNDQLDIALSAMRAAPTTPPTFVFENDTAIKTNNFRQDVFQFATQIIYKDGEESALSPYSKLAISQPAQFGGLEATNYNVIHTKDNLCVIKHNIDIEHPDMKAVRLLGRSGNDGTFFVIDEFDPASDVKNDTYSSANTIYLAASGEYKFYNDILGQPLSDASVNKLYDNVPLKAEGQSITASRLMYSNYTEGFDNITLDPKKYSITPNYAGEGSGIQEFATQSDANGMIVSSTGSLDFTLELENAAGIGASETFPAATLVNASFKFAPSFTATGDSGDSSVNVIEISDVTGVNIGAFNTTYEDITLGINEIDFDNFLGSKTVSINLITPEAYPVTGSDGPEELATFIQSQIEDIEVSLNHDFTNLVLDIETGGQAGDTVTVDCKLKVYFKFGEGTTVDDHVTFKTRISRITIETINVVSTTSNFDYFSGLAGTTGSVLVPDGNAQADLDYSNINPSDAITSKTIYIAATGGLQTFKMGATHSFGVVFYDKYGRSGFVNEIGSVYVKSPHERATPSAGPVSMTFDFSNDGLNSSIPNWADSYQIVYAGSNISDVFQYTVGGAYPRYLSTGDGTNYSVDTSVHNIYVSLKTLDQYTRDKDVLKNYSFTKGDKLRIISHRNTDDDDFVYPKSTSTVTDLNNSIMEFDVVGVETISSTDGSPLRKEVAGYSGTTEEFPQKGTFLVLTAPAVEGTADTVNGVNKYVGFDWHHVTGTNYNATDTVSGVNNFWNRNVLVEIITPKKATAEKVYYEIGERRKLRGYINSSDGHMGPAFTVVGGDVHYRPIPAKTPVQASGSWRTDHDNENAEEWEYTARHVEDPSVSELFASRHWDKGRAHSVFKSAAEVTRYNSITYSDAYADDTSVLSLSSFNPTLINFFDMPSEYGACRYIGNVSDKLAAVQEQKMSFVGVEKDVIETGSQSGLISLSTSVLNNISPFGGDFGTQYPESVLIRDGAVYFADVSRRAILRASMKGMEVLSDIDISSYVEAQMKEWLDDDGVRIPSGYDPDDNCFYITLLPKSNNPSYAGLTLGYNLGGFWQGTYTFLPTCYATINNDFMMCKHADILDQGSDRFAYTFSDADGIVSNQYPATPLAGASASKVTVVSNSNPSMVKQYNSISLEADSVWTTTLESSTGQRTASLSFAEKEDAFYANVSGDTSPNSKNQYLAVGTVKTALTASSDPIELKNKINGFSIPRGYNLYKNDGANGFTSLSATVSSVDYSDKTVTPSDPVTVAVDDRIFVAASDQLTGDQIRGHYCKINCEITPSGNAREELYSINANFVNSKANHALSQ